VAFLKDPEGQVRKNLHTHFPDALIRLFPSLPLREEGTHVARYAAHCLAEAGLPVDPAEAVARALKIGLLQEEGGRPRSRDLFFHPGSGDPAKNYTPAFWFELIKRLRTERMMSSMRLSMLLGPAERDTAEFFSEGAEALGIRLFTCPSRAQVLEFLGGAALYLGHDSGITHVAAMIGTPTVALFRKSDVSLWRPLGPCVVTLSHPGPETPAFLDQVIESIRDLLEASEAFACHHQTNPL
jgi:ADP-heptose:LPS heptosyltransferase